MCYGDGRASLAVSKSKPLDIQQQSIESDTILFVFHLEI